MLAASNWLVGAFNWLIMVVIVNPVLWVMRICFYVFKAIAGLNFFNESIYSELTSRIYNIVAVVMLFVFAYQIILLIINPDGGNKGISGIVKSALVSFILILILPTVFSYMSIFQRHIIDDNTIPAIILGTDGKNETSEDSGKHLGILVLTSMFYPTGTSYSTFYEAGKTKVRDDALDICKAQVTPYADSERDAEKICEGYIEGLSGNADTARGVLDDMPLFELVSYDSHGFTCYAILLVICGIYIAWLFISYSIDLATRAVKLAVLEIVAPIPVILGILPKTKDTFNKWVKELLKTYLEVFLRLAFIFLIVAMFRMVPQFIKEMLHVEDSDTAKPLVIAAIILGLTKFAKEAPELLKKVFASGDLFSGIDLKGGFRRRLNENDYLMQGANAASQATAGAVAGARLGYNNFRNNRGLGIAAGAFGGIGGIISGTRSGLKSSNRTFGIKSFLNQAKSGAQAAEDGQVRFKDKVNRGLNVIDNGQANGNIGRRIDRYIFDSAFHNAAVDTNAVIEDNATGLSEQNLTQIKKFVDPISDYLEKNKEVQRLKDQQKQAIQGVMNTDFRTFDQAGYEQAIQNYVREQENQGNQVSLADAAAIINKDQFYGAIDHEKRKEAIKQVDDKYKELIRAKQNELAASSTYNTLRETALDKLNEYNATYGNLLKNNQADMDLINNTIQILGGEIPDGYTATTGLDAFTALKKDINNREDELKLRSTLGNMEFDNITASNMTGNSSRPTGGAGGQNNNNNNGNS